MLNAKETNDLIIDIINSDFNNRSNSSCMIIDGIQGGHYNTDLLLASAIRECSHDSLYLVGMLLRLCQKPNIYFKGPDYKNLSQDFTGFINKEIKEIKKNKGKIVFGSGETFSSSVILNKISNFIYVCNCI